MKAYNFSKRGLTLGIPTDTDAAGQHVLLGETGRGRVPNFVRVERTNPPTMDGDRIVEADVLLTRRFVASSVTTTDVLVRVSSDGTYTRSRRGESAAWLGRPRLLAEGKGADGDAGRIGSWTDVLWHLAPGEAVLVLFGDGKNDPRVLWHRDGHLVELTREQAESLLLDDLRAKRVSLETVEGSVLHLLSTGKTKNAERLNKVLTAAKESM